MEKIFNKQKINSKIRHLSKECNQLNVRILQIRLNKQKTILDNFIKDPNFITSKHHNNCYFYQFNQKTLEQKYFIKLQDLLRSKKEQLQSQIQLQNNKALQKKQLSLKVEVESNLVSNNDMENLISNIYTLINEEPKQSQFKLNIKINDITKNLCPIVQYNRVKQFANKIKAKKQFEVIHI
ncbi:unnamed protein product [Paramecium primaurelia]|uniref:Uncharacterized protein n=1 Tax=Paramecium primaurelia TaxID=5886 RepID=A0A8S1NR71_PARPR|nr:unnamed protein product [Paramecium primaurelia]